MGVAGIGPVIIGAICDLRRCVEAAGSFYKSGKSRNWLKATNPDFVRM